MRYLKTMSVAALLLAAACNDDPVNPGNMWFGFEDVVSYQVGGANPAALAVADVNGDNRPDIITLDPIVGARVALGNATGGYTALGSIDVGSGVLDLRIADVNDDHIGDIVVIGGNELRISRGSPQGPGAISTHPLLQGVAAALAVGDFDNDLESDISVITTSGSEVGWSWWARSDTGPLVNRVDYQSVTAAIGVRACVFDVTGEGESDVVIATSTAAAPLVLFPNSGGVTFDAPKVVGAGVLAGSSAARLACGDFDGDGLVDVLLLEPGTAARLAYYRGAATGLVLQSIDDIGNASDIAVLDADGDGDADLVIARPGDEAVDLRMNDGEGNFDEPGAILVGGAPKFLAVQDVNRDGHMDIVMTRSGGAVAVLRNAGR